MSDGETFYTFSCTKEGTMKPAKIIAAKKIKKSDKIATIALDNGEIFRCTPDHKIMLRSGDYKEAKDLIPGESLMPCYIKEVVDIKKPGDRFKEGAEFHRRVIRSFKTDEYYRPYKMCEDGRDSGMYEYYIYRIMANHPDSVKHESYLNKDDKTSGIVRHHIDYNPLNDRPDNLMWCSEGWHGGHHGNVAVREKMKTDPELYNKFYVDSKNTESFRENCRQGMAKYYSTEEGQKMKENLRQKANEEWDNEKLRKWRSEETKKYAKEHPEWVKENTEKALKIKAKDSVMKVLNYLKYIPTTQSNPVTLTSKEFNTAVMMIKIDNPKLKIFYYDTVISLCPDSELLTDLGVIINKVSGDSLRYIRCEKTLEMLVDKGLEINEENYNNCVKELLKLDKSEKIKNRKGYYSGKKEFPELFASYEADHNNNHKVVSVVIEDKEEDVYCLEVDTPEHNFPLAAGVFCSNCEGLSSTGSLKSGRHSTQYHAVLPLRGKILNVEGKSAEQALDNKEIFTIFQAIGLGMGGTNITNGCKTPEEAYEKIKKYSRYGKIIIATD